jgi:Rieske Fe-S protein
MQVSRRDFIFLGAAMAAGCDRKRNVVPTTAPASGPSTAAFATETIVDAGPLSAFTDDRVYDDFREQGILIIRRDKKVFALSAVCTHKGCKVRTREDGSFLCKCHGSMFDRNGHVLKGPARRDLPRLAVATDNKDHLLVRTT